MSSAAEMSGSDDLVMGVDAGTESLRVGLFDFDGNLKCSASMPYSTSFPKIGYAEQNPDDWWINLGMCSKKLLLEGGVNPKRVKAISLDCTCCSVVALDSAGRPLRPCLLWMDGRSSDQCSRIMSLAEGDPFLSINSGGKGPLSAEWMLPKALWLKENEPEVWEKATFICEKLDFLNYHLTGCMRASSCNVAARWHFNAQQALFSDNDLKIDTDYRERKWDDNNHGRPVSLLKKIGLIDILDKWPPIVLPMGSNIGNGLTETAASHLGLCVGTIVAQGGPDAYVGMVGLGCVRRGQVGLITGSSHLHLCICDNPSPDSINIGRTGIWGVYRDSPLSGIAFAEGGQCSTGSVLSWTRNLFAGSNNDLTFQDLDLEAAQIPIGAEGLLALETFQGARTPSTDPEQRGALVGLSLAHTRSHIWRAFLESVCYGTRQSLDALKTVQFGDNWMNILHVSGGATRSELWLQMHADVTQLPVVVGECDNAPLLGCGVLATAAVKKRYAVEISRPDSLSSHINASIDRMVRAKELVEPQECNKEKYDAVYHRYLKLAPVLSNIETNDTE